MAKKKAADSENKSEANLGFEAKRWLTAGKLRNNMDTAESIYRLASLGIGTLVYAIQDGAGQRREALAVQSRWLPEGV